MAESKDFSAEAGSAKVVGTVSSSDIAEPVTPPMGLRAVGPRITFHFVGEWDAETSYVLYDVVRVNGTSYIANKITIAKGMNPETDNSVHWVKWNDPNAQVELLQQTVNGFDGRITKAEADVTAAAADAAEAKKASADNATAINAEATRAMAAEAANTSAIEAEATRAKAAEAANASAIEAEATRATAAEAASASAIENKKIETVYEPVQYYVETTGSDSNDGLSQATAFATIDYALNVLASKTVSGYINIGAGRFETNIKTISGGQKHFVGSGIDKTELVVNRAGYTGGWYNTYIHMSDLTLTLQGNAGANKDCYIEEGRLYSSNIKINCDTTFGILGGSAIFTGKTTFNCPIRFAQANVLIEDTTEFNCDNGNSIDYAVNFYNSCKVIISGSITVNTAATNINAGFFRFVYNTHVALRMTLPILEMSNDRAPYTASMAYFIGTSSRVDRAKTVLAGHTADCVFNGVYAAS